MIVIEGDSSPRRRDEEKKIENPFSLIIDAYLVFTPEDKAQRIVQNVMGDSRTHGK